MVENTKSLLRLYVNPTADMSELDSLGVVELAAQVQKGTIKAVEVAEATLKAIDVPAEVRHTQLAASAQEYGPE